MYKYTNVCTLWDTDTLHLLNFLLHSNLFGKRPADYAVSLEMQEIFQKASEGTKNANASLSLAASLSVVRVYVCMQITFFIFLLYLKFYTLDG